MQIDTVKIVTDIGNDIHWLVGIGNDGTALSPLAVELELDSADNYQIAGASGGGGGGVTTTHSCVGNPCGSCAFKFAAGDISGCTCLEGGEEKQCNHTVTQTSGGIIFQINQDYCPAE